MKFSIFLSLIVPIFASDYPYSPTQPPIPTEGVPWPFPKDLSFGDLNFTLNPATLEITTDNQCEIIQEAIQRYKNLIRSEFGGNTKTASTDSQFKALKIQIDHQGDCDRFPELGMNENYDLKISEDGKGNGDGTGLLQAPDIWGALRGLETFSQLIFSDSNFTVKIRSALISDEPRFAHRGILLDTSRHYLSINTIKRNLDLMEFTKFNVFHWHIVDDQSFPYVSKMFPNLSDQGSYTKRSIYSPENITDIINYARLRGIRVIPEFDTPGHVLSWGNGEPDILTACYGSGGERIYDYGVIDPSKSSTFDFMQKLFHEISQLFPDRYVHLGGDEVFFDCWRSNPDVETFMKNVLNLTEGQERKLEKYYIQTLINLLENNQSKPNSSFLLWQDVFDERANVDPANTIIQVWKGPLKIMWQWELFKLTLHHFKVIFSSCWYLNDIKYGANWHGYYQCDPQNFFGTQYQKSLILGGEACMWGEYIDSTNLLPTLWPRASAVAERLWSPSEINDVDKATPRIEEHRCRLVRRGYPASPVNGPGHCQIEYGG